MASNSPHGGKIIAAINPLRSANLPRAALLVSASSRPNPSSTESSHKVGDTIEDISGRTAWWLLPKPNGDGYATALGLVQSIYLHPQVAGTASPTQACTQ